MAQVHTVLGPIAPEELGLTLIHEHVMVDFIGADQTGPHRWDQDDVARTMQPYLDAIAAQGVACLVECTPNYLGRDPVLLQRLSRATGLHIVTNTGLYKEPYLPAWAFDLAPAELAERWIAEWEQGIDETGVRPGFIKIAVNPGPLLPIQQSIVRAAAITHLATGLSVMCHTGHAAAAHESLDLIEAEGMDPRHYLVAHADQIGPDQIGTPQTESNDDTDTSAAWADHEALLRRGAWLEYDAIGWGAIEWQESLVLAMLERGYEDQLLLSQDAGWYHVGEPDGGTVQPMTTLLAEFVPRLRAAGVTDALVDKLLIDNPRRVLAVG
jgi:predicted metal-dependent phosphotriesterase family hydrolase